MEKKSRFFYCMAAWRKDGVLMWMSVVGRGMAVYVFGADGGPWRNVAVFEGVCGGVLAAVLLWEGWLR